MKFFLPLLLLLVFVAAGIADDVNSLNLQYHYDFKREHPTATVEYFGTDKLGSTFFFVDFNFNHTFAPGAAAKKGGMSDGYFEIMRYFKVAQLNKWDVNLTVQYNDGSFPVEQIWFAGATLGNINLGPLNLSAEFLLKKAYKLDVDWQFTSVWFASFLKGKLVFSGYLDFWKNDTKNNHWPSFDPEYASSKYTFQSEPQLGYMLTNHWKLGTELEISRGFLGSVSGKMALDEKYEHDKWYFQPTLFVQYNF